jgi:hypothetical protein
MDRLRGDIEDETNKLMAEAIAKDPALTQSGRNEAGGHGPKPDGKSGRG